MVSIDRFEGKYAVIENEDGSFCNILRSSLPKDVNEGDCLIFADGGYKIDISETKNKRQQNALLFSQLVDDN